MTHILNRRKSSLKIAPSAKQSTGPTFQFQWSIYANHTPLFKNVNSSIILPTISADRLQKKSYINSSSSIITTATTTTNHSLFRQRISSHANKKIKGFILNRENKTPPRQTPLLLNCTQLQQVLPPNNLRRQSRARLSINSISNDKRNSTSVVNSKISYLSRSSLISPSVMSFASVIDENHSTANEHLVRLPTPQLRRLNVSEQYIDEAKKLYYNPKCRCFVPRTTGLTANYYEGN